MYFDDEQRNVLQIFAIFEFTFIIFSFILSGFACYIIWSVSQFHRNINGFLCNMAFAYLVLELARMVQIGICSFDPEKEVIIQYKDYNTTLSTIYRYLDDTRQVCLNSYVLTYFAIAIERTIATIKLKSYEKFKNNSILFITLVMQWLVGYGLFCCYLYSSMNPEVWEIMSVSTTIISFMWIVGLHFFNLHRYKNRKVRVYSLKERFQLSENVRFLRMILWCSITALLGGIVTLIIYFLPYNGGFYEFSIINSIYLNSFILIAILVFIVAIFTNPAWRRKFISMLKRFHAHVSPWYKEENTQQNPRFHAPHIKSMSGKPMVFNAERERELYFQFLKERF